MHYIGCITDDDSTHGVGSAINSLLEIILQNLLIQLLKSVLPRDNNYFSLYVHSLTSPIIISLDCSLNVLRLSQNRVNNRDRPGGIK